MDTKCSYIHCRMCSVFQLNYCTSQVHCEQWQQQPQSLDHLPHMLANRHPGSSQTTQWRLLYIWAYVQPNERNVMTVRQFMGLILHTQVCFVHGVLFQLWLMPSDQRPTQQFQTYVSKSPLKLVCRLETRMYKRRIFRKFCVCCRNENYQTKLCI